MRELDAKALAKTALLHANFLETHAGRNADHRVIADDLRRMADALNALPPQQEGWKVVPVEPTEAMKREAVSKALSSSLGGGYTWTHYVTDLWAAMLASAPLPAPPAPKGSAMSTDVPEDVRKAFWDAYAADQTNPGIGLVPDPQDNIEAGLAAAYRTARPTPAAVKVKALQWERSSFERRCETVAGLYSWRIEAHNGGYHVLRRDSKAIGSFADEGATVAAAQADYEARIMSAIILGDDQ